MIQLIQGDKTLDIELHQCGHLTCPPDWGEVTNATFHRIYYIHGGSAWVEISGKRTQFKKDCLYVMPVNTTYTLGQIPKEPLECTYIHLHTLPLLNNGITEIQVEKESPLALSLKLFKELYELKYQRNTISYQAGVLFNMIARHMTIEISENQVITDALTIIRRQYSEKISNKYLADCFGYNENYFIRLFSEHVGITPGAYVMKYRLGKAIEFILDGKPISVVASDVGYDDSKAFSRFFKKQTGVAPSDYKKYYQLAI